jgi:hypothetical protein
LRDPLLAPLAAIATGILLSRLVPFETRELGAVIAAYVIVSLVCLWRRERVLAFAGTLLALVAAGSLVAVAHRMLPAPKMDTEGALLILTGCVVEPSAISADRDQFVLELEPGARVRVSLYIPEGKQCPVLRYGQRVEFDRACGPRTISTIPANSITYTIWRARGSIGRRRRVLRLPSRSCRGAVAGGS